MGKSVKKNLEYKHQDIWNIYYDRINIRYLVLTELNHTFGVVRWTDPDFILPFRLHY